MGEARRRGRRRRRRARESYGSEARRHRRRGRRRYRGALENPLTGVELAITLLTGSVGFMAAELADRYMATREGAPNVTLAVNGGKTSYLAMYHDWPRLLVAAGITGAPLALSMVVPGPTWRSALQTMGIGAGLRSLGNIFVGLVAQLTLDEKKQSWTDPKNVFALDQSLTNAYSEFEKAKKKEGTEGLPSGNRGVGDLSGASCPKCGRRDGLGTCCRNYGFAPAEFPGSTQPSSPLPPPPPVVAEGGPPPVMRMPPPERVPPPQVEQPYTPPRERMPPTSTVPSTPAVPPPALTSMLARGPLGGVPRGGGNVFVPRFNRNWGDDSE